MAVPIPNLTLAAPSTATSSATFGPSFQVGRGNAGSLPSYVWIGAAVVIALFFLKKKKA